VKAINTSEISAVKLFGSWIHTFESTFASKKFPEESWPKIYLDKDWDSDLVKNRPDPQHWLNQTSWWPGDFSRVGWARTWFELSSCSRSVTAGWDAAAEWQLTRLRTLRILKEIKNVSWILHYCFFVKHIAGCCVHEYVSGIKEIQKKLQNYISKSKLPDMSVISNTVS
jgi:hypothetical protein